jgi:2'-5' RNA ligase
MQYLVLIEVPGQVEEFVDAIRRRHGFRRDLLKPHITLVSPFRTKLSQKELFQRLNKVDFTPFKQTISDIGFFENRNKVIYLNVVMNSYLIKLYTQVRNSVEDVSQKAFYGGRLFHDKFQPHVTIAKRLSNQEFLKAKSELAEVDYTIDWKVKKFWLYQFNDHSKWERLKSFG